MHRFFYLAAFTMIFSFAFVGFQATSHAQYGEPLGNVSLKVDNATPSKGSSTNITSQALDLAGKPVPGGLITFSIVSEPGNDAAVGSKTISKVSDAFGLATISLYAGTTDGVIVIEVLAGELRSTVLVNVGTPPPLAAPVVRPPSTGDAGLAAN